MLLLLAALTMAPSRAPLPPYRRLATVRIFDEAYEPPTLVQGARLYTGSNGQLCAYDLHTLKAAWLLRLGSEDRPETEALGRDLYVTTSGRQPSLLAVDQRSGRIRWRLSRKDASGPIVVRPGVLYLALTPDAVSALDLHSHKPRWTRKFAIKNSQGGSGNIEAISEADGGLAVNAGNTTYGVDATTGRVVWSEPESYMFHRELPVAMGIVWVPTGNGAVARQIRTGRVLWRSEAHSNGEFAAVMGDRFVGLGGGQAFALEAQTGKQAWSQTVGPSNQSGGFQYGSLVGDHLFFVGATKALICDLSGKLRWTGKPSEALPKPIWSDGKVIVCFDGDRLVRYAHGVEPALPADSAARKALAADMVTRFDKLDQSDIARLETLGDEAFSAVLKGLLEAGAAYDAAGNGPNSFKLYQRYHALGSVLMKVASAKRTSDLVEAIRSGKGKSSQPFILQVLAAKGSPKEVVPIFIQQLEGVKTPGWEMYESNTYIAREFILNSSDPRAVAFMLRQLNNPKGDATLREEAYWHLAGTGGEAELKAVLAERHGRALLRPIEERVLSGFLGAGEFSARRNVLAERKDASGRTWGLLTSGVLGSSGDLWLAEKVDGKWTHPRFTGVSTRGVSNWAKPKPPEPTFAGKTAKQLVDGAWFETLVGNPELSKDSDGDGLTDIEERRLGTDPTKSDTDGDGDPDGLDPWPNAKPRSLSDAEQLLAAVFEARYHFDESEGPALFFAPKDMKPFEMPGRSGPTMWVAEGANKDWELPIEQCYEQGVAFIRFPAPDSNKSWEERVIRWNAAHTEGTVTISTYYGGLNGTGYEATARKFGSAWVVISMRMAYVS